MGQRNEMRYCLNPLRVGWTPLCNLPKNNGATPSIYTSMHCKSCGQSTGSEGEGR